MGLLRGVVGFMTFLLAFELRGGKDGVDVKPFGAAAGAATAVASDIDIKGDPGAPAWHFGAVVVAAGIGALLGARLAPELRRWVHEERILFGVFTATAIAALAAVWFGGLTGAMLLSLGVALAAASGKLAFDSLVQRDAPDVNYGRSFARFEARFQLTWVIGAFIPVVLPLPERLGYFLVGIAAAFAAVTYFLDTRDVPEAPRGAGREPTDHDVAHPSSTDDRSADTTSTLARRIRPSASTRTRPTPPPDSRRRDRRDDDADATTGTEPSVAQSLPPPPPPPVAAPSPPGGPTSRCDRP